jgi:hypothetical protein
MPASRRSPRSVKMEGAEPVRVSPFAGARIETLRSASSLAGRGFVGVDLVRRTPARRLGMDGGSLLVADRDRLAGLSPER